MNTTENRRTDAQNRAAHLWFEMVAERLNDSGLSQKAVLEALGTIDCPNTKESVKAIFRAILAQVADVESTAEGGTTQYPLVYMSMCKAFAENMNVTLPAWPDRFSAAEDAA